MVQRCAGHRSVHTHLKAQRAGYSLLQLLAASQDGRDGGTALLETEHPHRALPYHSEGVCIETGGMKSVLCRCYPYLEQAPGTNSLMFTKPLGKAVRQIKGRKATIKDYQTPSLPGERPGAIHF